jgi:hypothetical protein
MRAMEELPRPIMLSCAIASRTSVAAILDVAKREKWTPEQVREYESELISSHLVVYCIDSLYTVLIHELGLHMVS